MRDSNLNFTISRCEIRNGVENNLRFIGAFNGEVKNCKIESSKDSIILGDKGKFRASAIRFKKNHIDQFSGKGISIGSESEASQNLPGIKIVDGDISGGETGIYLGNYSNNIFMSSLDLENNHTAIKIGQTSFPSYKPRNVNILGGTTSNNDSDVKIDSGSKITIENFHCSGNQSLKIDSNVDGPIYELNNQYDGSVTRGTETLRPSGVSGSKLNPFRLEMEKQDLTSISSKDTNDYRHHDGSGEPSEGLYRGDGSGGWVKIGDSSQTI